MDSNYKPCNTKSMTAFLFGQMDKLAHKEIDTNTAVAQAKLASQISNLLNYELKRTLVQIKLQEINANIKQLPELRDIESKAFDDTKMLENNQNDKR